MASANRTQPRNAGMMPRAARWARSLELPGPVGERNVYSLAPRGAVLCVAGSLAVLCRQVGAALATGNRALVVLPPDAAALADRLRAHVRIAADLATDHFDAVLIDGDDATVLHWNDVLARREGPIVPLQRAPEIALEWLLLERAVSTNTAAAGGNASLMSIG